MVAYTGYSGTSTPPAIRTVTVQVRQVVIISTTDTVLSCPGPWCLGNSGCNCAADQRWNDGLNRIVALGREPKSFIKLASLIPSKGYSGIIPPIQLLTPPITTAAPAPDDRRRAIWAFMTVRPLRVP